MPVFLELTIPNIILTNQRQTSAAIGKVSTFSEATVDLGRSEDAAYGDAWFKSELLVLENTWGKKKSKPGYLPGIMWNMRPEGHRANHCSVSRAFVVIAHEFPTTSLDRSIILPSDRLLHH